MSFRRKESSENQIKELFITSPMVSSPDFDKQDNCRGVDNKENFSYSKFNNKIQLLDTSSDKLSQNSDISSIPRVSASKVNASDCHPKSFDPILNYKIVMILIRSLVTFVKSCKLAIN